jgi:hypothetical protein
LGFTSHCGGTLAVQMIEGEFEAEASSGARASGAVLL